MAVRFKSPLSSPVYPSRPGIVYPNGWKKSYAVDLAAGMLPYVQNYWKMEDLTDSGPSPITLIDHGSPATSFAAGKWSNAAYCVGANGNYLSCTHGGIAVGPYAISLWFNSADAELTCRSGAYLLSHLRAR